MPPGEVAAHAYRALTLGWTNANVPRHEVVDPSMLLQIVRPDHELAQALLAKGRREDVVRYLDSVARFWRDGDCVATWKNRLTAGETPDLSSKDCSATR